MRCEMRGFVEKIRVCAVRRSVLVIEGGWARERGKGGRGKTPGARAVLTKFGRTCLVDGAGGQLEVQQKE